jgi:hypothetical protein
MGIRDTDVCGLTSHHLLVSCQIISAQNMASALATSCTAQAPTQHRHSAEAPINLGPDQDILITIRLDPDRLDCLYNTFK